MIIKHFASEIFSVCFIIEKSREKKKGDISCSSTNKGNNKITELRTILQTDDYIMSLINVSCDHKREVKNLTVSK